MPLPLFSIPEHVRNSIIQKLDFADFLSFHQCSQDSHESARNIKTKFPISCKNTVNLNFLKSRGAVLTTRFSDIGKNINTKAFIHLPVRFKDADVFVEGIFTEKFKISLMDLLLKTNSTLLSICFYKIGCSLEAFQNLHGTGKIQHMRFAELKQSDILSLNVPSVSVFRSDITSVGINKLLKEVVYGKRNIDYFQTSVEEIEKEVILDGVPNTLSKYWSKTQKFTIGCKKTHLLSIGIYTIRLKRINTQMHWY